MSMPLRIWLIKILAFGRPVAMNLHLTRGLYIDGTKSYGGYYYNIRIDHKADHEIHPPK